MCGIYGFSGHRPVDETKLRWLAKENMSRGMDSAGVASSNTIFKKAVKATDLIQLPGFKSTIKGKRVVQGHTRAKTTGSVCDKNAHPFSAGTDKWLVIGSHNGVISGDHNKIGKEMFGIDNVGEVDSQLIFEAIAAKQDIKIVSKISGSIACAFQLPNDDPDKIYLYRNGEFRPLHIGQASDGIYYSSEATPLHLIGCEQVWQIDAHKIYTLKNGEIIDAVQVDEPPTWNYVTKKNKNWERRQTSKEDATDGNSCSIGHHRALTENVGKKRFDSMIKVDAAVASIGADTDKLVMMIKQCAADIAQLGIEPLGSILSTKHYGYDDNGACLLLIKLVESVHKKPLVAWGIWADGQVEISGLTSISGCTVVKIPFSKIPQDNKPIKFVIYDPIDHLEPKSIEIVPKAASFMEVELIIPFREKNGEKGNSNKVTKLNKETVSERGANEGSVHNASSKHGELYDEHTGQNKSVLHTESTEFCGPRTEGALDEHNARRNASIKSTDSDDGEQALPLSESGRQAEGAGAYVHSLISRSDVVKNIICNGFKPKNKALIVKEMSDKDRIILRVKYASVLDKECEVDKLFSHATLLKVYDLETRKVSKPIENYVHELVTTVPYHYLRINPTTHNKKSYTNWLPSNVLKLTSGRSPLEIIMGVASDVNPKHEEEQLSLELEEPVFKRVHYPTEFKKNLCYRDYVKFIGFRARMIVTTRIIENKTMVIVDKDAMVINNLKDYHKQQNELLGNIRELLTTEHKTSPEVLKYREVLQRVRTLLVQDASDVGDYINVLEANKDASKKSLAST